MYCKNIKIQRPQEKGDVIILMVKLKAKNMIQKPATCFLIKTSVNVLFRRTNVVRKGKVFS